MASSSNSSGVLEAQFRTGVEREVAMFLQRFESLGFDDEIDDTQVEAPDAQEETYWPCNPAGLGASSSPNGPGVSPTKLASQTDDIDDVTYQVQAYLKMKELAKRKRDKRTQVAKLEESIAELDLEWQSLLEEAEINRLCHNDGERAVNVEMTKVLEQYRANGMKRYVLEVERAKDSQVRFDRLTRTSAMLEREPELVFWSFLQRVVFGHRQANGGSSRIE
jgi:hypothetical protein